MHAGMTQSFRMCNSLSISLLFQSYLALLYRFISLLFLHQHYPLGLLRGHTLSFDLRLDPHPPFLNHLFNLLSLRFALELHFFADLLSCCGFTLCSFFEARPPEGRQLLRLLDLHSTPYQNLLLLDFLLVSLPIGMHPQDSSQRLTTCSQFSFDSRSAENVFAR